MTTWIVEQSGPRRGDKQLYHFYVVPEAKDADDAITQVGTIYPGVNCTYKAKPVDEPARWVATVEGDRR